MTPGGCVRLCTRLEAAPRASVSSRFVCVLCQPQREVPWFPLWLCASVSPDLCPSPDLTVLWRISLPWHREIVVFVPLILFAMASAFLLLFCESCCFLFVSIP